MNTANCCTRYVSAAHWRYETVQLSCDHRDILITQDPPPPDDTLSALVKRMSQGVLTLFHGAWWNLLLCGFYCCTCANALGHSSLLWFLTAGDNLHEGNLAGLSSDHRKQMGGRSICMSMHRRLYGFYRAGGFSCSWKNYKTFFKKCKMCSELSKCKLTEVREGGAGHLGFFLLLL